MTSIFLHGPQASVGSTECRVSLDGGDELALSPARHAIVSAIGHCAQQEAGVGLALCPPTVDDAAFGLPDLLRRVGMRGEFAARLSKLGMRNSRYGLSKPD